MKSKAGVPGTHSYGVSIALFCEERLRTAQKGCFCVRNGSVTLGEESFAKQTQVMLLGRWFAQDMA
jgi:hypothetical protein